MIHCEWFREGEEEGEENRVWFYMVGLSRCVRVRVMIRGQTEIWDEFCACSVSDLYNSPATALNTNCYLLSGVQSLQRVNTISQ